MTTLRTLVLLAQSLVVLTIGIAGAAVVDSLFAETAPLLALLYKPLPGRERWNETAGSPGQRLSCLTHSIRCRGETSHEKA